MRTSARGEGRGFILMRTKVDKGEGESIFAIFLRTSFMDDPIQYDNKSSIRAFDKINQHCSYLTYFVPSNKAITLKSYSVKCAQEMNKWLFNSDTVSQYSNCITSLKLL